MNIAQLLRQVLRCLSGRYVLAAQRSIFEINKRTITPVDFSRPCAQSGVIECFIQGIPECIGLCHQCRRFWVSAQLRAFDAWILGVISIQLGIYVPQKVLRLGNRDFGSIQISLVQRIFVRASRNTALRVLEPDCIRHACSHGISYRIEINLHIHLLRRCCIALKFRAIHLFGYFDVIEERSNILNSARNSLNRFYIRHRRRNRLIECRARCCRPQRLDHCGVRI